MIGWENLILSLWNTCSNSNSIAHFLCIDLPRYLQERRKENSDCAPWEHSQLPLKPCSVLGRFEILTLLLNLLEVPGFNIHQAHLNTQYMAKDCILLFQRRLSPLCSLPSSFCRGLKAVHPEPAAFEISAVFSRNLLGGCPCRQDTVPVLWHLCWPSPECQEQSKIPTHNCQPFGLLVSDSWRKHLSDEGVHSRATNFSFLLEGKSTGLFTSIFNLQAGPTCHVLRALSWGTFSEPRVKSLDTSMQSPCAKSQHRLGLSFHKNYLGASQFSAKGSSVSLCFLQARHLNSIF